MLAHAASERGIHTFTGTYFADNRPVMALIPGAGRVAGPDVPSSGRGDLRAEAFRFPAGTG